MKTKITKRNVDAAEVLPKEYIIWHDTFPGFGLRVFPTGKKSYIFQYRHNGRTRRIAIGLHGHWTPDRAYRKAIELQNQVNEGLDPSGERQAISKDITVSALCDLYVAEVGATKKASTQVTDRSRIERHIKPLLGKLKVSAVSSADIDLFLRNVTNGATAKTEKTGYRGLSRVTGGKGTATRTLGLLGAVFSYAVKRKLRTDNPVREVIKPKDGKRERFLTAEELVRFGEALNTEAPNLNRNVVPALKLLIATGCRKSEILTLQWDDIDIVNRYLHLRDGKTGARKVPLNSIALSVISEIPRVSKCKITYQGVLRDQAIKGSGGITTFNPNEESGPFGFNNSPEHLIYVKSSRDFGYTRLEGVLRDPAKENHHSQQEAMNGIAVTDVKQWFSNRYLMEPHSENWPRHRISNLALAKTFFSLLDAEVSLSHVDSSTFDVMLNTPSGQIPFEYMSAGFRTSYGLIFGILKEIEFRRLEVAAEDFSGLILVDELDLHLHPTWHGPMVLALENAYPRAQLIVSTHSPHMIQHARPDNLIILPRVGSEPRHLDGVDPEFGLIGWSVEEILRDVMGMDDPRPPVFVAMMEAYEAAVTRRDERATAEAKAKILRALHPSSVIRQIIDIETI